MTDKISQDLKHRLANAADHDRFVVDILLTEEPAGKILEDLGSAELSKSAILETIKRSWLPEQIERANSKYALEDHPPLCAETRKGAERIRNAPVAPIREELPHHHKRRTWAIGRSVYDTRSSERTGNGAMKEAFERARGCVA